MAFARLSDAQANNSLSLRFNGSSTNAPSIYYFSLSTTTVSDANGTGVTEPSGSAFARVAVTKNATNFPNAASRQISNGVDFTFPTPTGSWGTPVWIPVFDAATSGNYVCGGAVPGAQQVAITSGMLVKIPAGSFVVTSAGT